MGVEAQAGPGTRWLPTVKTCPSAELDGAPAGGVLAGSECTRHLRLRGHWGDNSSSKDHSIKRPW